MANAHNPTIREYIEDGLNRRLKDANFAGKFYVTEEQGQYLVECWRPPTSSRWHKHRFTFEQYPDLDKLLETIVTREDWS